MGAASSGSRGRRWLDELIGMLLLALAVGAYAIVVDELELGRRAEEGQAILEETGVRAYSRALGGLIDFNRLFRHEEMENRIRQFLH